MKILRGIGFFVTTLIMYLGIPLIAWGLANIAGFFSSPQRLIYAVIVLILGSAVGIQAIHSPEGIRGGQGQKETLVPRQRLIRNLVIILLYIALIYLPFADRRQITPLSQYQAFRWVGVALFTMGIGLVYWSGVSLGRLYSADVTLQDKHALITTGAYKHIRHPRYSGAILVAFGMSLTFNSWFGLILSLCFIGVILYRIKDEEALMRIAFGDAYRAYEERTGALLPKIK
jgi:protein-S-isoprenylcysteine O-methyltransferase Ste14